MSGLTKILIVLQLVFSIALSVVVVMMVSRQESYKSELDNVRAGSVSSAATVAQLNQERTSWERDGNDAMTKLADFKNTAMQTQTAQTTKINSLQSEKEQLAVANAQLASQNRQSGITINSQAAMISALHAQVEEALPKENKLIAENSGLNRTNAELTTQNHGAEETIRRLQEQIAQLLQQNPTTGAASAQAQTLDNSTGQQTPVKVNGEITAIEQSAGRTYIETKLGTNDGVKAQTRLAIYRGNSYVGDAVVTTVTQNASVAVVLMVKPGEAVQKSDLVMSGTNP